MFRTTLIVGLVVVGLVPNAEATDRVIEIRGTGALAQYIQVSPTPPAGTQDKQFNVVVVVGDKVTWTNKGNVPHTATSDLRVTDSSGMLARLFQTGQIAANASASHEFTQENFDKAKAALGSPPNAPAGAPVHLGYFCVNHPTVMGGKLVLYQSEDDLRKHLAAIKEHKSGEE